MLEIETVTALAWRNKVQPRGSFEAPKPDKVLSFGDVVKAVRDCETEGTEKSERPVWRSRELLLFDIDDIDELPPEVTNLFSFWWKSPSGTGWHAGRRCAEFPDEATYEATWQHFMEWSNLGKWAEAVGGKAGDRKDPNGILFVSADPDPHVQDKTLYPHAEPIRKQTKAKSGGAISAARLAEFIHSHYNIELDYVAGQWQGPCFRCGDGEDRFRITETDTSTQVQCRVCAKKGNDLWLVLHAAWWDHVKADEEEQLSVGELLELICEESEYLNDVCNWAVSKKLSRTATIGTLLAVMAMKVHPGARTADLLEEGDTGPLAMFVLLAAASSAGKSRAIQAVTRNMGVNEDDVLDIQTAQGAHDAFCRETAEEGDDGRKRRLWEQNRQEYLFRMAEFQRHYRANSEQSAVLMGWLRDVWSRGSADAQALSKRTASAGPPRIRIRNLKIGLIGDTQLETAAKFVKDTEAGDPQRWLILPATDPDAEHVELEDRAYLFPELSEAAPSRQASYCKSVAYEVLDNYDKVRFGKPDARGHDITLQCRIAILVGWMHRHANEVHERDWRIAGYILGIDKATRRLAIEHARDVTSKELDRQGAAEARKERKKQEVLTEDLLTRLERCLRTKVENAQVGELLTRTKLRADGTLSADLRNRKFDPAEERDEIMSRLEGEGLVRTVEKGWVRS